MQKLTDEMMAIVSRFRKAYLASHVVAKDGGQVHEATEYDADDLATVKNLTQMFV